ncbi:MAG: hypothetical protein JSS66_18870 [Armatimonadetes bacterium]|nr:hypothetical protein [Armatimonadota bacterium]
MTASLTPAPPSAPATAEVREIARQVRLSKSQHGGTYESSPFVYFPVGSVEKLLSAIDALPSLTAPASAASWREDMDNAPVDQEVLLYCPDLGIANPERIELAVAHSSRGSHHSWATKWMPLPAMPVRALTTPAASQDSGEDDEMPVGAEGGSIAGNAPSRTGRCGSLVTSASPAPETTDVRERARSNDKILQEILDKDDRNSPEEYPEMLMLTVDELFAYLDEVRTPDIAATGGASMISFKDVLNRAGEIIALREHELAAERERADREEAERKSAWHSYHTEREKVTRLTADLAARTGERDVNADTINLILAEAGVERSEYLAVKIAETFDPSHKLPCGHHPSLEIRSVESDYRACELCEARSMMRDAETMERRHRGEREAATARADALQQRVEALEEALKPFANVAELDIGSDESSNDIFQQMAPKYCQAPPITVGDLRRALATSQNEASR